MKQKHREDLNRIQGAIIGIAASMGEDDREKKDVLRCASRMITKMLEDESEDGHETQSD